MWISYKKSKTLINDDEYKLQITLYWELLDNVNKFKYVGGILTENVLIKKYILIWLATSTSAMERMEKIWQARESGFKLKLKLYKSLVLYNYHIGMTPGSWWKNL